MSQWLRAEDPGSNSSKHMVTDNHLKLQSQESQCPLLACEGTACMWCTDMHSGTYTHKITNEIKIKVL